MARVTVEDCIEKVPNRFELVMLATQRARRISSGASPTIERDNDKDPVIALREIALGTVDIAQLKEEIISGYQRFFPHEEEETIDLMDGEKEWAEIAESSSSSSDEVYADGAPTSSEHSDDDNVATQEGGSSDTLLSDIAGGQP